MKKEFLPKEEFEEKLRNDFDNLTDTDFQKLIQLALVFSADNDEFIYAIAESCSKTNNLSFKQYKALNSFLTKEKRKLNTKTFNSVSKVVSKEVKPEPTITNYNSGGFKSNGKYQQPIKHKLY